MAIAPGRQAGFEHRGVADDHWRRYMASRGNAPRVFVVGFHKCGTASLYHFLSRAGGG